MTSAVNAVTFDPVLLRIYTSFAEFEREERERLGLPSLLEPVVESVALSEAVASEPLPVDRATLSEAVTSEPLPVEHAALSEAAGAGANAGGAS